MCRLLRLPLTQDGQNPQGHNVSISRLFLGVGQAAQESEVLRLAVAAAVVVRLPVASMMLMLSLQH
jgi:hypothetical protein